MTHLLSSETSKIVALFGGYAAVSTVVLGWLAKIYMDRSLEKEKARLASALEEQKSRFTATLEASKSLYAVALEDDKAKYAVVLERQRSSSEKHNYIYKSQFEVEFNAYQALWSKVVMLVDSVARFARYANYSVDIPSEAKQERAAYTKAADDAFFEANREHLRVTPFIDPVIHHTVRRLNYRCKEEIDIFLHWIGSPEGNVTGCSEEFDPVRFGEETQSGLSEIKDLHETLTVEIRERMASLLVIDE